MSVKTAIIIGAGPAGLTAADELLTKTDAKPLIFEMTNDIGGISKTVNYKGNRIDIGGHRFFSKSDKVTRKWLEVLPLEQGPDIDAAQADNIMLVRNRLSRILFKRRFFDYPLTLSAETLRKLGVLRTIKIGLSYIKAQIAPVCPEVTLEDFFINRFGRELYATFFRDYTEKVWGVACSDISKEWGAQRVKGLSVAKVILNAINRIVRKDSMEQKNVETSLIEQFFYPKYGPGYYWEQVAESITERGGVIMLEHQVTGLSLDKDNVWTVEVLEKATGKISSFQADAVFSSMPVRDLIKAMAEMAPPMVHEVADKLVYRDFLTVGVLVPINKCVNLPDNWIYIQENDVKVGRIQIFNNWSPYMVSNPEHLWLGLEYFCNEGDAFWERSDDQLAQLAADELVKIGFIVSSDAVDDSTVVRMSKAYPAYFGGYENFSVIRDFTDKINSLYLIGRNGMHRYNNMDHSMLTAAAAVEIWAAGVPNKDVIWSVNSEETYHEEK
ncbi:MAG: amine oxidase [Firmicutes bacterium]|nr:amine oxidase [Bacillota bacterium]